MKTGAYSEINQTPKMELFVKIAGGFQPLSIFAKSPTLDMFDWVLNKPLEKFD